VNGKNPGSIKREMGGKKKEKRGVRYLGTKERGKYQTKGKIRKQLK